MAVIKFETNFKEVERKLNRVISRFPVQIDNAVKNASNKGAAEVRRITPIDSTNLRKSIKPEKTGKLEYTIRTTSKGSFRKNPEKYVDSIEYGPKKTRKGKKGKIIKITIEGQTKQRNKKASRNSEGAYFMFKQSEEKIKKILREGILAMLRRIGRNF